MLQLGDAVLGYFVTGKENICIFFVYPSLRRFTTNDVCISHGQSREVVILLKGRIECCHPQMSYFTPISSGGKAMEIRISINCGFKPHVCWTV